LRDLHIAHAGFFGQQADQHKDNNLAHASAYPQVECGTDAESHDDTDPETTQRRPIQTGKDVIPEITLQNGIFQKHAEPVQCDSQNCAGTR
jgi:hypothetical protein